MVATRTLPVDYDLIVYSGTTFRREFRWLPDGSAALDFLNWSASMMLGIQNSHTPMITLSSPSGGVLLSTGGQIVVTMTPAQTKMLKPGVMYYSLDLTDSAGTVTRFLRGRLTVIDDVGRSSYA